MVSKCIRFCVLNRESSVFGWTTARYLKDLYCDCVKPMFFFQEISEKIDVEPINLKNMMTWSVER